MLIKQRKKKSFTIQLAPLIDVVFILLIFFAVSSSLISSNKAIPLDLPSANSAQSIKTELNISITKTLEFYINQQKIDPIQLESIISQSFIENPDIIVVLNADKTIAYDTIISTLDTIRNAGCDQIALQVNKTVYVQ